MILSGIDIGTNSLRLLIAETGPGSFKKIFTDRKTTRLGEDLDRTGVLSPSAWNRSLQTLIAFKKSMDVHAVQGVVAVGTSALRNSGNSAQFIAEVFDRTGIRIAIISGEEEARLTRRGVFASLQGFVHAGWENTVVIDIGGGSTEIMTIEPDGSANEVSLPLGAVYLTERFLKSDPPAAIELKMIRNDVRRSLNEAGHGPVARLVGTAGTVATLASMDQKLDEYNPDRINGYVLTKNAVKEITRTLSISTLKQRRMLQGLEPGREDIILAGAIVALEIMDHYRIDTMLASDWGLREGIILNLYDKIITGRSDTEAV